MNSVERHEARYQRRKARRLQAIADRSASIAWDDVFGFKPLIQGYRNVAKTSRNRTATQKWMSDLAMNASGEKRRLDNGTWRSRGFNEFRIMERGKWRDIKSVHISEKGIQNTLCNNCLVTLVRPHLIYDNGASLKGKGTDFALDRFTRHLRSHVRKYGRDGGIYFFDFKSYFANIRIAPLKDDIRKILLDEMLLNVFELFVDAFGEAGLGLGSQVSQISAVYFPNRIDHYIKDQLGIYGFGRYMDDGYIIHHDIEALKKVAVEFEKRCMARGIIPNPKKCVIIKLHRQFSFLKTRFFITESGKVIRRLNRPVSRKERGRLKAFKRFSEMGLMTYRRVYLNFHSWLLSLNRGKSFHVRLNMIRYFNKLFDARYMPTKTQTRKHKVLAYIAKLALTNQHLSAACNY